MVLELAEIRVHADGGAAFETAIAQGLQDVLRHSPGFIGARVERGIEDATRYLLLIEWQTLEDHTIGFRQSERFAQWRAIVGRHFAEPPRVEHFTRAMSAAAR
jgi:heme-degrading monooxygenase HmoA